MVQNMENPPTDEVTVPLTDSLHKDEIQLKDSADEAKVPLSNNVSAKGEKKTWYREIWERDRLMIFIIIAVALGFIIGIGINSRIQTIEEPRKTTILVLLGFPGELLMRMLKMLILPLIISSLIVGLADLDQQASGRLGRRAVLYYFGTTLLAVILGIVLVYMINPGSKAASPDPSQKPTKEVRAMDSLLDIVRNLFPENVVQACFQQARTTVKTLKIPVKNVTVDLAKLQANETMALNKYLMEKKYTLSTIVNKTSGLNRTYYTEYESKKSSGTTGYTAGTNILGLVVFSIAVGLVAGRMGPKAKPFVDFIIVLNDVVMILVVLVMWYSPIGIWSLISAKFASMKNISGTFESLGMYICTIILGLGIHALVVLPGLYLLFVRKNPFPFVKGIVQALLTAFGTSSSSATLPITFRCLEENNKIDKRVTRFVLPVGATINMDGTALYEAVAAIFIAQASNIPLNFGQIVAISITATLASIGAAGIPQAGLVTMLIVLQTIGLPEESISLILSVDWFLDRIRTTVNVLGDSIGAGIVAHLSKQDLLEMSPAEEAGDEIEGKGAEDINTMV